MQSVDPLPVPVSQCLILGQRPDTGADKRPAQHHQRRRQPAHRQRRRSDARHPAAGEEPGEGGRGAGHPPEIVDQQDECVGDAGEDPCELVFGYALPSGESFTLTAHAVYLPRPRIGIDGPQGIQATFDWQAARDPGTGRMATATLTNDVDLY